MHIFYRKGKKNERVGNLMVSVTLALQVFNMERDVLFEGTHVSTPQLYRIR